MYDADGFIMEPCWNKLVTFWLLILNSAILGLGVCVSGVGVYIKYFSELLDGYVMPLAKIIPSGGGTEQDVYTLYDGTAMAFIGIGLLMFIVGVLGCVLSASSKFMAVYAILMAGLIFIQLTVVGILAAMQVDAELKDTLLSNFVNKYKGDQNMDEYSKAWNYLFVEFDCCAVNDYRDFLFCYWDGHSTINNETFLLELSATCCKLPGEYPDIGEPYDSNCTINPTPENSFMWNGCVSEVDDYLLNIRLFMMLVSFGPVLIEVGCSVLMIWLQYAHKRDKRHEEKKVTEKKTPPWMKNKL